MRIQLDLINPFEAWLASQTHGELHRFTFFTNVGVTGHKAELILRQYGIPVWGREAPSDNECGFQVKMTQAIWAEYLLCRAGIRLSCPLLDPRNAEYSERHERYSMPTPWTETGIGATTLIGRVMDFMDRIIP